MNYNGAGNDRTNKIIDAPVKLCDLHGMSLVKASWMSNRLHSSRAKVSLQIDSQLSIKIIENVDEVSN